MTPHSYLKNGSGKAPRALSRGAAKWLLWAMPAAVLGLAELGCSAGMLTDGPGPDSGGSVGGPGSGGTVGTGSSGSVGGNGVGPGSGGGTGTGGGPTQVEVDDLKLEGSPVYYDVIRMTHAQWENSVRDLLELPAAPGLSTAFFPDALNGFLFSNNERGLYVTDTLGTDYQRAAETLAEDVTQDAAAMARLGHAGDPAGFIAALGERAHKRPLTSDEAADYLALWNKGPGFFESGNDFNDGARIFLEALLQSTHFVHRITVSPPGRLSGPELATKISYLLKNSLPSEDLMATAKSGGLDTNAGLASAVTAMLGEEGVADNIENFFAELYGLNRYSKIEKDEDLYPTFTTETALALEEADRMFFTNLFTTKKGVRDIFTSKTAFVNNLVAPIYGLTSQGAAMRSVELGDDRPGFLTRAGFLALNGTLRNPDPIHRGVDINRRMLCAKLDPPAGTIPPIPTPEPGQTNREAITALTQDGFCGECHMTIINPPGFALEGFDAVGKARTMDNGKPLDTTGSFGVLAGNPAFEGAADLAQIMAEATLSHGCFSARLAEYSLTRDMGQGDVDLIRQLQTASHDSSASMQDLLLALVQSPSFTNAN